MMGASKHGWVVLLALFGALLAPTGLSARTEKRPPLYVSFIDQLPAQGEFTQINGLDERRRGPLFQQALNAVVGAHELGPVVLINHNLSLPSTRSEEPPVPPGATLVRVYLTQWSNFGLGGYAADEVLCRIFVEVVRDGKTVAKLGPFLGRNPYTLTEMTTADGRYLVFRDAARIALGDMAHALPR